MRQIIKIVCGLLLVINLAYTVTGVARFGSQHIDAYGIWLLKAKAISIEEGIPFKLLTNPDYGYSHQTYPLLLPMWLSLGDWTLWSYPVVYGVILWLMYRIMRNEGQSQISALWWTTAASYMGPLIAQGGRLHAGLADIWITLLVAICVWATQLKRPGWIVLAVMIACQIKVEGILLLAFLLTYSKEKSKKWRWAGLAILPFAIWQVGVRWWGIGSDVVFGWPGVGSIFQRLGIIVVGMVKEMLNWRNWYVIWPLWGITGIWQRGWPYMKVLGLMAAGYAAVYLLADLDTGAYVASSLDRIMLQLLPLWWLGVVGRKAKAML